MILQTKVTKSTCDEYSENTAILENRYISLVNYAYIVVLAMV